MSSFEQLEVEVIEEDFLDDGDESDKNDGDYMPPKCAPKKKIKRLDDLDEKKKMISRLVKVYPCLWDKKDKNHRNNIKREDAWSIISAEMGISGKFVAVCSALLLCCAVCIFSRFFPFFFDLQ